MKTNKEKKKPFGIAQGKQGNKEADRRSGGTSHQVGDFSESETGPEENPEVVLLKNQLARMLADYDNLRKRSEEEKTLWVRFSTQRVLTTLIPILDNFESAQKHLNDSGLAIAISEFKKVFAEEGLDEILPNAGDDFDHDKCEVVETVETEDEKLGGKISELVLSGWKFKSADGINEGKLIIRHAKVKVYKKV